MSNMSMIEIFQEAKHEKEHDGIVDSAISGAKKGALIGGGLYGGLALHVSDYHTGAGALAGVRGAAIGAGIGATAGALAGGAKHVLNKATEEDSNASSVVKSGLKSGAKVAGITLLAGCLPTLGRTVAKAGIPIWKRMPDFSKAESEPSMIEIFLEASQKDDEGPEVDLGTSGNMAARAGKVVDHAWSGLVKGGKAGAAAGTVGGGLLGGGFGYALGQRLGGTETANKVGIGGSLAGGITGGLLGAYNGAKLGARIGGAKGGWDLGADMAHGKIAAPVKVKRESGNIIYDHRPVVAHYQLHKLPEKDRDAVNRYDGAIKGSNLGTFLGSLGGSALGAGIAIAGNEPEALPPLIMLGGLGGMITGGVIGHIAGSAIGAKNKKDVYALSLHGGHPPNEGEPGHKEHQDAKHLLAHGRMPE